MVVFMLQGLIIGAARDRCRRRARPRPGVACSTATSSMRMPDRRLPGVARAFGSCTADFAVVVAGAVLICFLATIYPSRQAARLDPVQALRYR